MCACTYGHPYANNIDCDVRVSPIYWTHQTTFTFTCIHIVRHNQHHHHHLLICVVVVVDVTHTHTRTCSSHERVERETASCDASALPSEYSVKKTSSVRLDHARASRFCSVKVSRETNPCECYHILYVHCNYYYYVFVRCFVRFKTQTKSCGERQLRI